MESINREVGNKISLIRKTEGLSQKELADKSGLAQNSIGNYERGERSPTIIAMAKIAKALGVPLGELVEF